MKVKEDIWIGSKYWREAQKAKKYYHKKKKEKKIVV